MAFIDIGRGFVIEEDSCTLFEKRDPGMGLLVIKGNQDMGLVCKGKHLLIADSGMSHASPEPSDFCRI
jgi:hypothetical protein